MAHKKSARKRAQQKHAPKGPKTDHFTISPTDLTLRDEAHFQTQLTTRSATFKPHKGRGSFRRHPKHKGRLDGED